MDQLTHTEHSDETHYGRRGSDFVRGGLDDGLDESPWWARFALRVGMPTAVACFLVWFLMHNVTSDLQAIRQDGEAARRAAADVHELMLQHEAATSDMTRYLRLICLHTAMNNVDRATCIDGR